MQGLQAGMQQGRGLVRGEILQVIAADNTTIPLTEAGRTLRKVMGGPAVAREYSL